MRSDKIKGRSSSKVLVLTSTCICFMFICLLLAVTEEKSWAYPGVSLSVCDGEPTFSINDNEQSYIVLGTRWWDDSTEYEHVSCREYGNTHWVINSTIDGYTHQLIEADVQVTYDNTGHSFRFYISNVSYNRGYPSCYEVQNKDNGSVWVICNDPNCNNDDERVASFTFNLPGYQINVDSIERDEDCNATCFTAIINGATETNCSPIGELISHYYQCILDRAPDPGGEDFWEAEALRMQECGSDLKEVFRVIAKKFFGSPEYINQHKSNDQFLTDLYCTFFNREPDSGGFAYWMGQLADGLPRDAVLCQFIFSPEFEEFMRRLFGDTSVRTEINMVGDFYRGMLGRLSDKGGFCYWLSQFRTAQCQGSEAVRRAADAISKLFLNSKEYSDRNRNHEQYVLDLYCAFLRRGVDLPGLRYWVEQLNRGALTREQVRQAFVAAPEFQGRVGDVIADGCNNEPCICN